ncbi:hypothetical protein [Catenuloplanes japonicus]|uniref:hypothetical protein n=1 Tax=Catenuloplanes japonicus TaxID=33876 RepID=UPI0005242DAE|nr:hypothetical protein [Catenuloplanes japonicus]
MTVDDGLTPAESAILIALMVVGDEVTNPDLEKLHGVDVRKENREKLNLLGYVTSAKKGRSFTHVLTEKGWARVNGELNFADKRSKTLGGAMAALHNAVRLRIGSFGELFSQGPVVPAQRPEPEPLPVEKDDLAERIRNVYATLTSGSGAWVSLASLRPHFADVPRADLDEALKRLGREENVHLAPEDNQKTLTTAEIDAAVRSGGQDKHLLAIGV